MTIHNEPPPAAANRGRSDRPQASSRRVDGRHGRRVVRVLPLRHRRDAGVQQGVLRGKRQRIGAIFAALVTYAVGFLARPLGGIVFGHFGDKYGRKKLLQFAILLVGAVTFLMGCLPTYGQIGVWAPALLVVLRFLQGFAVGGEWGGAVLLVAEHSPNRSRAFWASWPQAAVPVGNMLATVVLWALTATLSEAAFLSWGWRVAFWLSAVVVLVGYYIRTKVTDAPIFVAAQQEVERVKAVSYGVVEVLKRYPRGVFTAMGLRFAENIMYYLVVIVSITYLKDAGRRRHQRDPVVAAGRPRRALPRHPTGGPAGRPVRPASRVPRRRGARRHLGLLRVPDDGHRQLSRHHGAPSSSALSSTPSCTPRSRRSWPRCSRPGCGIPVSRLAIRSPRSWQAPWPRSSP